MSALIASAAITSGPGALPVFRRLIAFLISSPSGLSQLTCRHGHIHGRCASISRNVMYSGVRISTVSKRHSHQHHVQVLQQRTNQCEVNLRIILEGKLAWNARVENTCKKKTQSLNFIKRNLWKCHTQLKEIAYNLLQVTDYANIFC